MVATDMLCLKTISQVVFTHLLIASFVAIAGVVVRDDGVRFAVFLLEQVALLDEGPPVVGRDVDVAGAGGGLRGQACQDYNDRTAFPCPVDNGHVVRVIGELYLFVGEQKWKCSTKYFFFFFHLRKTYLLIDAF